MGHRCSEVRTLTIQKQKEPMKYDKETVSYKMNDKETKLFNDHVRKTRENNVKVMSVKRETHRELCIRTGITQYDL